MLWKKGWEEPFVVFFAKRNICQVNDVEEEEKTQENDLELTYEVAKNLASLPLECYDRLNPEF